MYPLCDSRRRFEFTNGRYRELIYEIGASVRLLMLLLKNSHFYYIVLVYLQLSTACIMYRNFHISNQCCHFPFINWHMIISSLVYMIDITPVILYIDIKIIQYMASGHMWFYCQNQLPAQMYKCQKLFFLHSSNVLFCMHPQRVITFICWPNLPTQTPEED